jgi:hypothetical protein
VSAPPSTVSIALHSFDPRAASRHFSQANTHTPDPGNKAFAGSTECRTYAAVRRRQIIRRDVNLLRSSARADASRWSVSSARACDMTLVVFSLRFFQVQRFKYVTSAVPYVSDFVRDLLRVIGGTPPPHRGGTDGRRCVQPARPFCCLKPFPENAMMSPTPNVGEFGNACGMCRLISSRRVGRSSRR